VPLPTPHLEKLTSALENEKLPTSDRPRLEATIARYQQWISSIRSITTTGPGAIRPLVALLQDYKLHVDVDVIFNSPDDFLYRQKGQLKLDNSIIEEFLPHLIEKASSPALGEEMVIGPNSCFSAVFFTSNLNHPGTGGGLGVRSKAQDFAVSRKLFLKSSYQQNFSSSETHETFLAYVAAECKTNLDKTMFQEACATAHDVKTAVSGAKYFLLCEWLDMTPLSTTGTDIDEVLVLRKAKRLNSNVRSRYGSAAGRSRERENYIQFLSQNPFCVEVFERLINHISRALRNEDPDEADVLGRGYF